MSLRAVLLPQSQLWRIVDRFNPARHKPGCGDVEIGFCQASPRSRRALGSRPRRLPGSLRDRQFIRVSSKVVGTRTRPRGATPERQLLSSALSTLRHHGGGPGASPRRKRAALRCKTGTSYSQKTGRGGAAGPRWPPRSASAQRRSAATAAGRPTPAAARCHTPPHRSRRPTHKRRRHGAQRALAGRRAAPQRAAARSHTPLAPTNAASQPLPSRRATPRTARRPRRPRRRRRARKQ